MKYRADDIVKSCRRLESGLRFGPDGIRACTLGAFAAPFYWTAEEASRLTITKEMIVEKRKWLFDLLNNNQNELDFDCKHCQMVVAKRFADVQFTRVGQIDHAATSLCNLRCKFCGFTHLDLFIQSKYDDLAILRQFTTEDIEWDSVVDFNGGEPTLLPNVDEYLDYFASRRIRVRFMTNGVKFHQSVYDGLANGCIQWVCTSVDAGTPSTYMRIKKRDHYLQVMENLTRYAHAGSRDGGMLAIKYIFCNDNCSDDDIAGFSYAMLAIRPRQVWLTFDFSRVIGLQADSENLGDYDFSRDIAAYAKMYNLLKKHGIDPVHYTTGHLALVSVQGRILLDRVMKEIERTAPANSQPDILIRDFRHQEEMSQLRITRFDTLPLRIFGDAHDAAPWSLRGKQVLLAPACPKAVALLSDPEIQAGRLLGFLDRDRMIHGKSIQGMTIHGYEAISSLAPDVIIVASPPQHQADIVGKLAAYAGKNIEVAIWNH
ncbi:MAG: radical SAM protein [Syntrophobacteraceae bacterium]